jgi:pimeloyl-ACP methyl ester carboxylesterase
VSRPPPSELHSAEAAQQKMGFSIPRFLYFRAFSLAHGGRTHHYRLGSSLQARLGRLTVPIVARCGIYNRWCRACRRSIGGTLSNRVDYAFLHGGGQGGWVWQETIAALRRQLEGEAGELLALDVPGCGRKRGRPTDDLTMDDTARELIADIEAAGAKDVILVGHSQAGQAMNSMVKLKPGLIQRLVYVSCSAPLPGQNVQQMIGTGLHGAHSAEVGWPIDPKSSSAAERYALMFCNDMQGLARSDFLAKLGKDMWPRQSYSFSGWTYGHLDAVPATFVICLKVLSLPPPWEVIFAARVNGQKLVRIDAGHLVMNTRPEGLAEILRFEAL